MFSDLRSLHQLTQTLKGDGVFEGYTDSNGQYFDGGMDGFVIDLGPGHQLKIETSQYGESTFQCMEHNCMLEGPGGVAYYH